MAEAKNELEQTNDNPVDDRGTDAAGGLALLRRLRDNGFESDDEKFAVALGRPVGEVAAWMGGSEAPRIDIRPSPLHLGNPTLARRWRP
jgi:hypothetical protein